MSDYIPQEVLIDILTRLPVLTLVRCTKVCKSWHSLITSPNFISHYQFTLSNADHHHYHLLVRYCTQQQPTTQTQQDTTDYDDLQEHYSLRHDDHIFSEYSKFNFPFKSLSPHYGIIGSCNGLICLSDDMFGYNHTMFVWNPSIHKAVAIPKPNVTYMSHGHCRQSLGFGFDSLTNDFKVIIIVRLKGEYRERVPPQVEVYSLKSECWGNISTKELPYLFRERCQQAYVNGTLHWVAIIPREEGSFWNLIVSFNMNQEVFHEMTLPDSVACEVFFTNTILVAFEESLALIQHFDVFSETCHRNRNRFCCIWMMKEYGVAASWAKLFNIDRDEGLKEPLGLRRNGEVLLLNSDGCLVSYDHKSKRVTNLGILGTIMSYYWNSFYVVTYKESLFLLDKGAVFCDSVLSDLVSRRKEDA